MRACRLLAVLALGPLACTRGDAAGESAAPREPAAEAPTPAEAEAPPDPGSAAREEPVSLGPGTTPPARLEGDVAFLRELGASGDYAWSTCIFSAVITSQGRVTDARWLRPESAAPEVREAILAALASWRFRAAESNGKPVAVRYTMTINHCPCLRTRPAS